MPYDIHLELNGRILRVRYSGQVGVRERSTAAEAVFARADYPAIDRFLLDYRGATYLPGDQSSNRRLAQYLAERLSDRQAKVAWLVNYDHQLGLSVERLTSEFGIPNQRFYDYDAAIAWLQQPLDDPAVTATTADTGEEAILAQPSPATRLPRRALALAMMAAGPTLSVPPVQFAAVTKLVDELLDEGLDEDKVMRLARRMFEIVNDGRPIPAPSSTARG